MIKYSEKLRNPKWQKKRLKVLERDNWECQICFDKESTLNVHHRYYEKGKEPWEYDLNVLVTLCEECHQSETESIREESTNILQALKKHFFASDINCIAAAIYYMEPVHSPEVIASALSWLIHNPERMKIIVSAYLESLIERRKKFEEKIAKNEKSNIVQLPTG